MASAPSDFIDDFDLPKAEAPLDLSGRRDRGAARFWAACFLLHWLLVIVGWTTGVFRQ